MLIVQIINFSVVYTVYTIHTKLTVDFWLKI